MSNKRYILPVIFFLAIAISLFMVPMISAAQSVNFITPLINFTNVSGSTYTLEVWVNGSVAESYIRNVTWYYQPWSYLNNGSWITIGTTENTSTNQTVFTLSWDTTALSDAEDYLINATALNYAIIGANLVNATNRSGNTTIDNTAPTLAVYSGATLTAYTNGTIKTATSFANNLTFNISVSDATIGMANKSLAFCIVNVNNEFNHTVPLTNNRWCNSSDINISGLSDGNKTVRIWINDTLNTLANSTLVVQVDTTPPTATASCSPTTVQTGDTYPCSCSGTDATSGLNTATGSSTSPDGTATPSHTGTFTFTCSTADFGALTTSVTSTYTVNQPPSSGSSSSSSGGGAASGVTTVPSKVVSEISPGTASVVKNFDASVGLKEIQINVNNKAQNVKVDVKKYAGKPAAVSLEKSGKVYQYIQIEVSNVADKLESAKITTKVEKTWVSSNGLEKEDVAVSKFDNTSKQWNELATTYSSEDSTYYYYDVEVTSFSYFAIGQKSTATVVVEEETASPLQGIKEAVDGNEMKIVWVVVIVLVILSILYGIKRMRK